MQPLVLVVEDEPVVAEITCRMLATAGYRGECATRGGEALALLENGLDPDAAIIDIYLPDMMGTRVAEYLLERHPETPIVLTSAYPELQATPPELPGAVFLPKPYTVVELVAVIRQLIPA